VRHRRLFRRDDGDPGGDIKRGWISNWLFVFRGVRPHLHEQDAIDGTVERVPWVAPRSMVEDVLVGTFLSGWLESSTMKTFAHELNHEIRCWVADLTSLRKKARSTARCGTRRSIGMLRQGRLSRTGC
jgi:hypothetical protein